MRGWPDKPAGSARAATLGTTLMFGGHESQTHSNNMFMPSTYFSDMSKNITKIDIFKKSVEAIDTSRTRDEIPEVALRR